MTLAVIGHSYSTGTGATHWYDGCIDELDVLFGGFSLVSDDFDAGDTDYTADAFTRANDAANLSTAADGPTDLAWTALSGTWGITSNTAYCSAAHATKPNVAYVDTGTSDIVLEVATATVITGMGLAFRIQDVDNYYFIRCDTAAGGSIALFKRVAGVETSLGSTAAGMANGNRIQVIVKGNKIAVNNGSSSSYFTFKLNVADNTFPTGTKHGLRAATSSITPRFDDFYARQAIIPATITSPEPTQLSGAFGIVGGSLVMFGPWDSTARGILVWETGEADGQIEMTHGSYAASTSAAIAFRVQDKDNCLIARVDSGGALSTVSLYTRIAGVETVLTNLAGTTSVLSSMVAGKRYRITFSGTRIRLWNDTDNPNDPVEYDCISFTNETKHGFSFSGTSSRLVDLRKWRFTALVNLGNGGTTLTAVDTTAGWVSALRYAPTLGPGDGGVLLHHLNDMLNGTGARALKALRESTRSVISRLLSNDRYEDDDPSCAYGGGHWSTVTATNINTGTGYHSTATAGDTVTIAVDGTFDGGIVVLRSIAVPADAGATCTVTVDGDLVASIDTNGIWSSGTNYAPVATRLEDLAPGAHTIVITVATVAGHYYFDGWWTEPRLAVLAPRVVVCNVAMLDTTGLTAFTPDLQASDIRTCNQMISELATEFPLGMVGVGNLDGILNP